MYKAIVIGVSAGGLEALGRLFDKLNSDMRQSIIIVQHMSSDSANYTVNHLDGITELRVKEIADKEIIENGVVYIAPPNYHILIEKDYTITLSTEEKIHYSRPSIDILFETAAEAYQNELIGVVLTGASSDGTNGLKKIKQFGGYTIVQSLEDAEFKIMPKSALEEVKADFIGNIEEIASHLNWLLGRVE